MAYTRTNDGRPAMQGTGVTYQDECQGATLGSVSALKYMDMNQDCLSERAWPGYTSELSVQTRDDLGDVIITFQENCKHSRDEIE